MKSGMIYSQHFVTSETLKGRKQFKNFVDYINRENAIKGERYSPFIEYMDNPEKTSALFTANKDRLNEQQKQKLKEAFTIAQNKNSPMWQGVISFDNDWLEENSLFDSNTKEVRDDKLMEYGRAFMNTLLKKEDMDDTAVWSGAIHYNTDNIHIHFAIVDVSGGRERGKMKYKSIAAAKSSFISKVLSQQKENQRISEIMRDDILGKQKRKDFVKDKELSDMFLSIYEKLPELSEDRRNWKYNYSKMNPVRADIDKLSEKYIELYGKEDFDELNKLLDIQEGKYQRAYKSSNNRISYKENKLKDLKTRMGNTILAQMREYDKMLKQEEFRKKNRKDKIYNSTKVKIESNNTYRKSASEGGSSKYYDYLLMKSIKDLKRLLKRDSQSMKNQIAYEKMNKEIEKEEEMQI